jgi:hypothetical protein
MNKEAKIRDFLRGSKNLISTVIGSGRAIANLPKEKSSWNIVENFKNGLKELQTINSKDKKNSAKTIYRTIENYGKTQEPSKHLLAKGIGIGGVGVYGANKLFGKKQEKKADWFNKKSLQEVQQQAEKIKNLEKQLKFRNGVIIGGLGTAGVTGGGYALKNYLEKQKQEQQTF